MTPATGRDILQGAPFKAPFDGARIIDLRHGRWGGVGVQVKEQRFHRPFQADLRCDHARFSVVLELAGDRPEARNSLHRSTPICADTIHQMNFAPADCPVWACAENTRYFRTLSLYFRHGDVGHLAEDGIDLESVLVPRLMFFDPSMLHIAGLLEIACCESDDADDLYIETLILTFLLRLSNLDRFRAKRRDCGGLTPTQLRRATEYLCEHLAGSIGLEELATMIGLSRSHFSTAFRKSTGMPPHRWLLERRILKSKEYLLGTNLSIAQVALAVGFSDQAHFSRAFSQSVGTSPGTWRRLRAS